MIIELPDTTVSKVARQLVKVREEGGAVALGRVLTLIIATRHGLEEEAIDAANDASREHPMRVIVLMTSDADEPRLDAQIRVGGDAGASEVLVLHALGDASSNAESLVTGLLLPDAPVVAWWPDDPPRIPSDSPLGRIAQRRITDASTGPFSSDRLSVLGDSYGPGDTDLAWTRLTHWREQLAAVLDQPPFEPVTGVEVHGAASSPSTALLAAWLRLKLDVPVDWRYESPDEWEHGIKSVRLTRAGGDIVLERPEPGIAVLTQPGQPDHDLVLPRRTLRECLAEELRRLDPDVLYGRVITEAWPLLGPPATREQHGA
ncbi:MAG TPA: glucose-6-phosphate dehydrogenase assembly protein OpcA [Microbacterium sp.]|nr:glucose-6-phosphate dehydrogenase assembly protein OpcA [Microbacterium sp.]